MDVAFVKRAWIEICTDNEQDWAEVKRLYVKSFDRLAPFLRFNLDYQKRRRYLEEYFKYLYETELSRGRAGLSCVKTKKDDGSTMIIYASCFTYNRQIPTAGDHGAMEAIVDNPMDNDIWQETAVHEKIREASKILNFDHLYGIFVACHPDFMRSGIAIKFQKRLGRLVYDDGVKRGYLNVSKPCLYYGIIDDMPGLKFSLRFGLIELAHLYPPGNCSEGTDPSSSDCNNDIYVFGSEPFSDAGLCKKITEIFKRPSSRFY